MSNPIDLTDVTSVKAWLGSSVSADDAELQTLVTAASQFITDYLSRPIKQATYSEVRDGNGGASILTSNYPIISVTSVYVDGVSIPAATYGTNPNGYLFGDYDISVSSGYCFRRDKKNVQINYTAGFATVPYIIAQVCCEIVGQKYRERDRIGQVSKRIEGETVSFSQKDLSDSNKLMLRNYVNNVPV